MIYSLFDCVSTLICFTTHIHTHTPLDCFVATVSSTEAVHQTSCRESCSRPLGSCGRTLHQNCPHHNRAHYKEGILLETHVHTRTCNIIQCTCILIHVHLRCINDYLLNHQVLIYTHTHLSLSLLSLIHI